LLSNGRLWLIGGTQESVQLAVAIAAAQLPCTISVTTAAAKMLYPDVPTSRLWVGQLAADRVAEFLRQQQIVAVLDASHPYAVAISQSAIAAALKRQIPYLRYERPTVDVACAASVIHLDDFHSLLAGNLLSASRRVLLTIGYKPLPLFQPWQEKTTLFARILPSAIALEAAGNAGFPPDRLICLRPPISAALETALWRQWQISLVVTKASGTPGGEDVKISVATALGIPLAIIARPTVAYPQQTSDLSTALKFCHQFLSCD